MLTLESLFSPEVCSLYGSLLVVATGNPLAVEIVNLYTPAKLYEITNTDFVWPC